MLAVVDTTLKAWKARLAELERQIRPLAAERDQLRDAIEKVERVASRWAETDGGAALRSHRVQTGAARRPRAPTGRNRRLILEAIKDEPKTATQVARETNIAVGTVSTTLTKLVKDGLAMKAERGYRAA